ncbi:MAG: GNAT family N-acetyltransferase [Limnothrix sp. BL-A-16]
MSFPSQDYQIAVMAHEELSIAIDWARAEGWNPGLHDADCFYAADPQGFLVGKLDHQPIATISAVKYGHSFGFIGFYIVHPDARHQGYGIQIWQRAIEILEGRTIGLDGVVAQQENYQKSGFTFAHRNIRFAGISDRADQLHPDLVPLSVIPFEQLKQCDRRFFPEQREQFLRAWIDQPHAQSMGILEGDRLCAYGVIRACHTGYKIGPLNAETPDLADALIQALMSTIPLGSTFHLDVPEPNTPAIALAEMYGMQPAFETARMYRGRSPELPLGQIFGITSFELG